MQFSKKWLQTFFSKSLNDFDLSNLLTMAGLEVDDIKNFNELSDNIVVAEIVKVEKHPKLPRLSQVLGSFDHSLPRIAKLSFFIAYFLSSINSLYAFNVTLGEAYQDIGMKI